MDLVEIFQRTHHFTRTSLENIERFRESLGLSPAPAEAEITENRKLEVTVDFFEDWHFSFQSHNAETTVTKVTFHIFLIVLIEIKVFQFSPDEACECEYVSEGCKFLGRMTKYGDTFTFTGSAEEGNYSDHSSLQSSSQLVVNWNVSKTRIVQTTTLISSSGPSGIKLNKSKFELIENII